MMRALTHRERGAALGIDSCSATPEPSAPSQPAADHVSWPLDDIVPSVIEHVRSAVEDGVRGVRVVHVATRKVRGSVGPAR